MDRPAVERVRAFNRIAAKRIGTVGESFLNLGRPYGESRFLWEVGSDGADVRELRSRLGLDSGYASRVVQSLVRQGLIAVEKSSSDKRVRRIRRTKEGEREVREIDRRSDELAWSLLQPLGAEDRKRLLVAMTEVERLLRASMVTIAVEDPRVPDSRWCIAQYFKELQCRFEGGFDAAATLPLDADDMTPPAGALLIARIDGKPVGCGALKFYPDWAYLKRMWVATDSRGIGLGRRLLSELERYAREHGVETVRLETNRVLTEAIALYRSAGYHEVPPFNDEPYAHHWFEKSLP